MTSRVVGMASIAAGLCALFLMLFTIRSHWAEDRLAYGFGRHELAIDTLKGGVLISRRTDPLHSSVGFQWQSSRPIESYDLSEEFDQTFCGFGIALVRPAYRDRSVVVHKVLLRMDATAIVLGGLAIAPWFFRRQRVAHGKCPKCAYILGRSTDRCPECGNPVSVNARSQRR